MILAGESSGTGKLLRWCGVQSTSTSFLWDILTTNDNLQRVGSILAQLNTPREFSLGSLAGREEKMSQMSAPNSSPGTVTL